MILLDVNVLVAAFLREHSHHASVRPWFDTAMATEDAVVVPDHSWIGFLRIVTNPRIFPKPATMIAALAFLDSVSKNSAYRAAPALGTDWAGFAGLTIDARVHGNLVPDAYLAAVALRLACPVATMDRDFRRFPGLVVIDPTPPS